MFDESVWIPMDELQPSQFSAIAPLVRNLSHSVPVVCSVVEGNNPGRVFVDRTEQPRSALVCTTVNYLYLVGDETDQAFTAAVPGLMFDEVLPKAAEKELILFTYSDACRERMAGLLREKRAVTVPRHVFKLDVERFAAHRNWRDQIPAGLRLVEAGAGLVQAGGLHLPFWPSIGRFLEKGFAYCLMSGEEVVASCVSVFAGGGHVEIDINTAETYRRRGMATLVASAFIERCLAEGLVPDWNCWPHREASRSLALKLGYVQQPDLLAVVWAEGM